MRPLRALCLDLALLVEALLFHLVIAGGLERWSAGPVCVFLQDRQLPLVFLDGLDVAPHAEALLVLRPGPAPCYWPPEWRSGARTP